MPRPAPKYDAAMAELRRTPNRSDQDIAAAAGCGRHTVRKARAALLEADAIPRRSVSGFTAQIRARWPGWTGSRTALAREIGCTAAHVSHVVNQMDEEAALHWKLNGRNGHAD